MSANKESQKQNTVSEMAAGRGVYVLEEGVPADAQQIDLYAVWIFARRYALLIALLSALGFAAAVTWVIVADRIYRAEILVAVVDIQDSPSIGAALQGGLGSLVGLAGIDLTGAGSRVAESKALLGSRSFIEEFVAERKLLPILFASRWNDDSGEWITDSFFGLGGPNPPPSLQDAYISFKTNIMTIREDRKTGLVTVQIEWPDRFLVSDWANGLVSRANRVMRERAISESNSAIEYLRGEIDKTDIVGLQQALYAVVEGELQKRTIAKTREDFAFRVIDRALSPEEHLFVRPNPLLAVFSGLLVGFLFGVVIAVFHSGILISNTSAAHGGQRDD